MKYHEFEKMEDVRKILKKPMESLVYLHGKDMVKAMEKTERILTVHLYPIWLGRKKRKCLLDLNEWSYHQIYICKERDRIFYSLGHGRSSFMRQSHSFFIQTFLERKDLRRKTITAVIVTSKESILAYFFYMGYAYSNHDVGSNWDQKLYDKVRKTVLPFSYITDTLETPTVKFVSKNEEATIYKAMMQDIWSEKIEAVIRKAAMSGMKSVVSEMRL